MVEDRRIPVYALNVAASPHPPGVYLRLLTKAAKFVVPAHGSDWAKITAPSRPKMHDDLYTGRILVWTEIDLKGKWYDTSKDAELSEEIRKTINIPPNAKPNYRAFDYVFSEKKHRLYFEATNDLGKSIGPTVARRVLLQLLSRDLQGLEEPSVEVTLVPKDGTVRRILAIPGLRKLTIRVVLPNPDATDPATLRRVRARLQNARAKSLEETYVKQPRAKRLIATDEIRDTAEVAALNGFVSGEGGTDEKPVSLSTANEPRKEIIRAGGGVSFLNRLLASVVGLF